LKGYSDFNLWELFRIHEVLQAELHGSLDQSAYLKLVYIRIDIGNTPVITNEVILVISQLSHHQLLSRSFTIVREIEDMN